MLYAGGHGFFFLQSITGLQTKRDRRPAFSARMLP